MAAGLRLLEDRFSVRYHLEAPTLGWNQFDLSVGEIHLELGGQTGRPGLVASISAVLDGDVHRDEIYAGVRRVFGWWLRAFDGRHPVARCQSFTMRRNDRADTGGFTLIDVTLAMAIVAILTAISFPRAGHFLDSIAVQGASSDAFAIFSSARNMAVNGATQATVDIDTARAIMSARIQGDTVLKRDLALVHEVRLSASRPSITFSASGMGYGAGNLTLVITRGRAVDSLFVSRLGRVRH